MLTDMQGIMVVDTAIQCRHMLLPPSSGTKLPLRFDCDLLRHFCLSIIRFAFQTKFFLNVKKMAREQRETGTRGGPMGIRTCKTALTAGNT